MRTFDKKSAWLKNKELNNEKDLVEVGKAIIVVFLITVFAVVFNIILINLYK